MVRRVLTGNLSLLVGMKIRALPAIGFYCDLRTLDRLSLERGNLEYVGFRGNLAGMLKPPLSPERVILAAQLGLCTDGHPHRAGS